VVLIGSAALVLCCLAVAAAIVTRSAKQDTRFLAAQPAGSGRFKIAMFALDGLNARHVKDLTAGTAADTQPAWSPDGAKIAFCSERDGIRGLYVMEADGTNPRLVAAKPYCHQPAWSPDSKRIVFVAGETPQGWPNVDIYVVNRDRSNLVRLTKTLGNADVAWSPDGQKISFVSFKAPRDFHICVIPADGGNIERLTPKPGKFGSIYPVWSPDGKRLAYGWKTDAADGSPQELFVSNVDDMAHPKQLTRSNTRELNRWPSWSPDGQYIFFYHMAPGKTHCRRIKPDGSDPHEVVFSNAGPPPGRLSWEPAAERVLQSPW